ncbi:hypothetical protein [Streptomyces olivaceus]|uniref:hypothetical protein n=1 Tax=Streptomyces olivaceus TaxID=47716 RepID=UPI004055D2FF
MAVASAVLQLRLTDLDALNATFTMPGAVDLIKRRQGRHPYKAIWVNPRAAAAAVSGPAAGPGPAAGATAERSG